MSSWVTIATWEHAPHITDEAKADILDNVPEYEHDARSKGLPRLGSGHIFRYPEKKLFIEDFPIPDHWLRGYGMDVGWKWTAALAFVKDPKPKVGTPAYFVYDEYKEGKMEPEDHCEAIKEMSGAWNPGCIDPSANTPSQRDGLQLLKEYRALGLRLRKAERSVNGGIVKCQRLINSGSVKIFKSCEKFRDEYRKYRRDMNGKVVKKDDHLLDCFRYFILSGLNLLDLDADPDKDEDDRGRYKEELSRKMREGAWMV